MFDILERRELETSGQCVLATVLQKSFCRRLCVGSCFGERHELNLVPGLLLGRFRPDEASYLWSVSIVSGVGRESFGVDVDGRASPAQPPEVKHGSCRWHVSASSGQ